MAGTDLLENPETRTGTSSRASTSSPEEPPSPGASLRPLLPLGALLLVLPACLPWPHHQRRAPALQGVVLEADCPVEGLRVHRRVNAPPKTAAGQCLGEESVLTDAEGRFAFPEEKKLLFFFVFGDRLDRWSLCFEREGAPTATFTDSAYWGGPPKQTLTCELQDESACNPTAPPEPPSG